MDIGLQSDGMQAQMIARLYSMTVHTDEFIFVQGVSERDVAMSMVVMRRTDVMQTLSKKHQYMKSSCRVTRM